MTNPYAPYQPNVVGQFVRGERPDGTITGPMMAVAQDEETITWAREDGEEIVWKRGSMPLWLVADMLHGTTE